jgi:hypothetical protein
MLSIMSNEPKTERVQLMMEQSLRRAVRAWRFANEIESEGEAIRQLLMDALELHEKEAP